MCELAKQGRQGVGRRPHRVLGGRHPDAQGPRRRLPRRASGRARACASPPRATTTTTSTPRPARSTTSLTANPGLVGVFADNNTSGTGAARAIKDNKAADRIPVVAFDTDPQENAALTDGSIDALVVQNPYFFGYQGVVQAGMAAVGSQPPLNLDPGAVVADKANMGSTRVKPLLNPPTAKAQ